MVRKSLLSIALGIYLKYCTTYCLLTSHILQQIAYILQEHKHMHPPLGLNKGCTVAILPTNICKTPS